MGLFPRIVFHLVSIKMAGIVIGLQKGHVLKKRSKVVKPVNKKGALGKRRAVAREVSGFAPYERRMIELLRNGLDKRALQLAKRRIGTHTRAKRKREELSNVIRMQQTKKE